MEETLRVKMDEAIKTAHSHLTESKAIQDDAIAMKNFTDETFKKIMMHQKGWQSQMTIYRYYAAALSGSWES